MKKSPFQHIASKLIPALLSALTVLSVNAGELKVATVNMTTLLNEYHKTKSAEKEEKVETENIRKLDAERISSIQAMVEELRKFEKEFNDPSLSAEKKKEIAKVARDRQSTLAALQEERKEFLSRSRRALNQKMVGLMDEIREHVVTAVNAYAATQEADFVFDESGLTSNQVPFLVYVRDREDITSEVLKKLNKETPASSGNSE